ncbi:MAG: hypothetical protein QW520_02555 [Methanomassiliicoccales archaeon]
MRNLPLSLRSIFAYTSALTPLTSARAFSRQNFNEAQRQFPTAAAKSRPALGCFPWPRGSGSSMINSSKAGLEKVTLN